MDIRDAVNAIADLANAIEEAINEAEGKEGEITDQLETLERKKFGRMNFLPFFYMKK